jgi:2-polyprenyl-3-methyl-5-hydroxy-6-metoxy-1,4-benzoquinol methylase
MNESFITLFRCPVCGSDKIEELYSDINDKIGRNNKFSVSTCRICSHAFTNPLPDSKFVLDYYSDSYYSYNIDIPRFNRRIKFRIKNWLYKSSNKNIIYSLISKPIIQQTAIFPKYIPGGKILDIGCGNGAFLSFMKEIGWKTFGTEISRKAVEVALKNGHEVFEGNISDANYSDNFFDTVTLNNVFEHIPEPAEFIREIYRVLKPGGELIIGVPNFSSYSRKIFKSYWAGLLVPEHLHHFTGKSLKMLAEINGYRNVVIKGIFRTILWQNLRSYTTLNNLSGHYLLVYIKTIVLMILTLFLFPLIFLNAGMNFCMFMTLYARK